MRGRAATRLRHSRAVGVARYHLYRDILLAWPRRRECNICGWRGRRFLTYWHRDVLCPQCGSQVRHRLLASVLGAGHGPSRFAAGNLDILHVSPEYCLTLVARPLARRYVRADYASADCDVKVDLTRLPFAGAVFDLVIASDVLEHITDDRRAMAEIRRVLRPRGAAILTVPQSDSEYATEEDPGIVSPEAREAAYGQPDHVRHYGLDFADRVSAAGFTVTSMTAGDLDRAGVDRYVLRPPYPVANRLWCNDRRVHVAERT